MKIVWRILAIVVSIFTLGGFSESYRIFTSMDKDIADNRSTLIPMAILMNLLFAGLSILLWRAALKKKKNATEATEFLVDDLD